MIECSAPGKLFIAGEYAVLDSGSPALLVAVDRFVRVSIAETSTSRTILASDIAGGATLRYDRGTKSASGPGFAPSGEQVLESFRYVLAAISIIDQLLRLRRTTPRPFELRIASALRDPDGRKLGLGASAAVTVATIAALCRFYGLPLGRMERYRLAMLATLSTNPRASGGDLAAATWGGWLLYHAPERDRIVSLARVSVERALTSSWPGLEVRSLPAPSSVRLFVGWTGKPVRTETLVGSVGPLPPDFLTRSRSCVGHLAAAIDSDNTSEVLGGVRQYRSLLSDLSTATGLRIMTPALAALITAAESVGGAGKTSGAGGGDCGIALLDLETDPSKMLELWRRVGIEPLPLQVHQNVGISDDR